MSRSSFVGLLTAGMLLAGCGTPPQAGLEQAPLDSAVQGEPAAAPTVTPTPVETPTPTPTSLATVERPIPPFNPTGEFTELEAMWFGYYYVDIINHVRVTGDPSLLLEYALPECDSCIYILEGIEERREYGARLLHPELFVESAAVTYFDPVKQEADVRIEVTGDLAQVLMPDGTILHEPKPLDHAPAYVQMTLRDGRWWLQESL